MGTSEIKARAHPVILFMIDHPTDMDHCVEEKGICSSPWSGQREGG